MGKSKSKESINTPGHENVPGELKAESKVVKVEILGSVYDGVKYLTGIVEMDEAEALNLIDSGHVKLVVSSE